MREGGVIVVVMSDGNRGGHRAGKWHGIPYDVRRLTWARGKSRWFNAGDPRLFTPKALGAGWTVNLYWVVHPIRYARHRSTPRS